MMIINKKSKIHIFGASGAGVSTLGKALSLYLQVPFFDSDDFYWKKTDPPFLEDNPKDERKRLLKNAVSESDSWVVSGTLVSWGNFIQDKFDFAIYLSVPSEERIRRVKRREAERFSNRIEVGGDMYEGHLKFLTWVAQYDEGHLSGRSKTKHEAWIKTLKCPVLRIDGVFSLEESLLKVLNYTPMECKSSEVNQCQ
jgi:adenylate kinase family enzyme